MGKQPFIEVRHGKKTFRSRNWQGKISEVQAVNDVSLTIYQGETLGLVGESGSGKTTLGRLIVQLETLTSGEILVNGQSLQTLTKKEQQTFKQQMQIIFQDPYSALNPQRTALELVMEPLIHHTKQEAKKQATKMLALVGISGAAIHKFPRDFSGGQRQRIGIARAVVAKPSFVLCDEPTSALDASIQVQIIELLRTLQKDLELAYLFISHDLSVIRQLSDRIAVMYQGHLVEIAPTKELFENPQHEYTKKLLAAIPVPDPRKAQSALLESAKPNPIVLAKAFTWQEVSEGHFVRIEGKK